MSKALLINPSFTNDKSESKYVVFPFGLGYVAGYAEKNGHEIEILDILAKKISFDDVKNDINKINFEDFSVIGITGIISQYKYVKNLVDYLRIVTDIMIVIGGPLASYSYDVILNNMEADVCVYGEGEVTFLELLNKKNLNEINGIIYKENNTIQINEKRGLEKDIDRFGMPAYHLFDMKFYVSHSGMMNVIRDSKKKYKLFSLITSRGCPFDCNFCSKSMPGYRGRSMNLIFKEIDYLVNHYNIEGIHFLDELLISKEERFFDFCERIKKTNLIWDAQGRINLVTENMLKKMKEANGACIGFGVESGSQVILNAMNKKIKVKDTERILKYCNKINLPVKLQLIYGYPGESRKTLKDTAKLFWKTRLPGRRMSVITPLPGSQLYEVAKSDGFIGDKETDLINEADYHEFLSTNKSRVTEKLFYNRTEFKDEDYIKNLYKIENKIFNQFLFNILLHPFYVLMHWSLYKIYIYERWTRTWGRINIFKKLRFFILIFTDLKEASLILNNKLNKMFHINKK